MADTLRFDPNAFDKEGNAYWYFEGSSGVMYKEGPPKSGRKSKPPEWEPVSRGHEVCLLACLGWVSARVPVQFESETSLRGDACVGLGYPASNDELEP